MPLGGRAWRGWFPLGGELTSGRPDWKEGLYLGTELGEEHPRVAAACTAAWPQPDPGDDVLPGLRRTIVEWMAEVTALGHRVMQGIAGSLDLPADYFASRYTADPLILFRIFQYPSRPIPKGRCPRRRRRHTDYGLLTLLRQDSVGGLLVHTKQGWIEAAPVPESFVCNIGDMLDRMTGGLYRSTPHRVRLNTSGRDRLSFPLFFDPDFDARITPSAAPPPTTTPRAGTVRACTTSKALMATTFSARSARCSQSCGARCSSGRDPQQVPCRPRLHRHEVQQLRVRRPGAPLQRRDALAQSLGSAKIRRAARRGVPDDRPCQRRFACGRSPRSMQPALAARSPW
jgi:isopenicillin N synthase-like dioxygenase